MSVELYKTANVQTLLICEAMLGQPGFDGQVYNKIGLVLVLRDNTNKALKTPRYYLDIPAAKVLCHDLWESKLCGEYKEFKKVGGNKERAFQISPNEGGSYRILIMNSSDGGERERLYYLISPHLKWGNIILGVQRGAVASPLLWWWFKATTTTTECPMQRS
jgi:hypothetical protein